MADADADSCGSWVQRYFDFKSDPKSCDEQLAESTLELRKSVYRRTLEQPLGKKTLKEIKATTAKGSSGSGLSDLFDAIKADCGPGPAVHTRELVLLVYRFAIGKGEFIDVTWKEIDCQRATWTIPAARMKAGGAHVVPLSEEALDILTTLRSCFPSSQYLHPGRYDSDIPIGESCRPECSARSWSPVSAIGLADCINMPIPAPLCHPSREGHTPQPSQADTTK